MTTTPLLNVYRMTVYEPGSETTIWTPAAGAPHAEEFKVATKAGISGFQPYMNIPRGNKGKINAITKKLDIGSLGVELGDQRTSDGQDVQRWISAFWGDDDGKMRAIGTKCFLEESLDGGTTWSPYFVGELKSIALTSLTRYRFTIKEQTRLQKIIDVFAGEPSASVLVENGGYANRQRVMPLGPSSQYGPVASLDKIFGIWRSAKTSRNRAIDVRSDSTRNQTPGVRWSSKPFIKNVYWDNEDAWKKETEGAIGPIVRVNQGSTVGRYYLTYADMFLGITQALTGTPLQLQSCLLEPIASDQFEYAPLNQFTVGTGVEFEILLEQEPSENFPLLVSNVHPIELWRDLLLGMFSTLNPSDGSALFSGSIRIDEGAFDTLIADESFREVRFVVPEKSEMSKFIEDKICKPFNLGYRLEPTASAGNAYSQVVPFSMALPTSSVGIQTITEDDLVAGSTPSWAPGESFIVFKSTWYREALQDLTTLVAFDQDSPYEGPANPTLLSEQPVDWVTFDVDNVYGGKSKPFTIDAKGLRAFPFEFSIRPEFPFFFFKMREVKDYIRELHDDSVFRWSRGVQTVTLNAQRTGSTNDLQIGQWRLLDVAYLPDQFSHERGGTRLMQCVERSEQEESLKLSFVDSGRNIQTAAPNVGAFSQVVGTSAASGNVWVTNASVVQGGFAVTEQTVSSRPDPTASSWNNVYRETFAASETKSVVLGEIPANSRVWPRFRTWPRTQDDFTLASDWVYPPAPGYFDMTALTSPSTLTATQITAQSAHLEWINTNISESIEVRLKAASSASFDTIVYLKARTNRYDLYGLSSFAAVNPYTASVRYRDGVGGFSADAQVTFTCTGPLQTCPDFDRIEVVQDPIAEDGFFPIPY